MMAACWALNLMKTKQNKTKIEDTFEGNKQLLKIQASIEILSCLHYVITLVHPIPAPNLDPCPSTHPPPKKRKEADRNHFRLEKTQVCVCVCSPVSPRSSLNLSVMQPEVFVSQRQKNKFHILSYT